MDVARIAKVAWQ